MAFALERATTAGRQVVGSAQDAGRDLVRRVSGAAKRTRKISAETTQTLAQNAGPELADSVTRLTAVRRPSEAATAFEAEVEHLLQVVAPVLVSNPLPIRDATAGRVLVAGVAVGAATAQEAGELSLIFSSGVSAPGIAGVVALALLSLYTEMHVAASIRVHALENAGRPVEPERIAYDVAAAMVGSKPFAGNLLITRAVVKRIAARVLRRWGAGLVPLIGIAYSAWDSQATIAAIATMPITDTGPTPALPLGTAPALAH